MSKNAPEPNHTADIAIVGGGMVGMTLALMLARTNCAARIALIAPHDFGELSVESNFDARSTALSFGSIQLFRQLGIWDSLSKYAADISNVAVSDKGHLGYTSYSDKDNGNQALGAVVENVYLGQALSHALGDCDLITAMPHTEVSQALPKAASMNLIATREAREIELNAKLVVLADGALSPLAKQLGIEFTLHDYKQHAVIANLAHEQAHKGCAFECFDEEGPLAMLPLPDYQGKHRSALVWTRASDNVDELMGLSDAACIERLQQQFGYRLGSITELGERQAYPLQRCVAKEQVRSSLVLMGNAAHFLHPVAGQGFNLAIRDCAELCAQLKQAKEVGQSLGALAALQKYEAARLQDQWLTTELSHQFIQLFASTNILKQALRGAGLIALNQMPPIKTLFFEQMMGASGKGAQAS